MKSILTTALILCFSAASMAQELKITGNFDRKDVAVYGHIKSKKSCRTHGGKLMKEGCVLASSLSKVEIVRNETGNFTVGILSKNLNGKSCKFVGEADMLNQVQLISKVGACDITIGFQNSNTLSVMTNDAITCASELQCEDGAFINIDDLKRLK